MVTLTKKIIVLVVMLGIGSIATASSVKSISIAELTDKSEVIFEGSVSGLKTVTGAGKRNIHTVVTFEVIDMIKGNSDIRTLELSYLGGKSDHGTLVVTDMSLPVLGERGIYFVEQPGRKAVHPLNGWAQGHFLVKNPVAGIHSGYVTTQDGSKIYDIDPSMAAEKNISSGKAAGIVVNPLTAATEPATIDDFKDVIREMAR